MNNLYNTLIYRFNLVKRRHMTYGFLEALFSAVALSGVLLLVSGLAEGFFWLSPPVKTLLLFSVAGAFVLTFAAILVLRLLLYRPSTEDAALMVEKVYPQLGDRLISAVQLGRLRPDELRGQSTDLVQALIRRTEEETRGLDLARAVPSERYIFVLRAAAIVVAFILVLTAAVPGRMAGGIYRLVDYSTAYTSPGSISIVLFGHKDSIIRGDNYSNQGMLSGWSFQPLNILYRWEDSGTWNVKPVDVDPETGRFAFMVEKPGLSFSYYLEAGTAETSRYQVNVIERPVVENIEYTLTYPAYTGLGTIVKSDGDGNIRALVGTGVDMRIRANKELVSMAVHRSDSTTFDCEVTGNTGALAFTVLETVDYHIEISDTLGIMNLNPITYRITCLADEPPTVTIASPPTDVTLPISMAFPLVFRAADDYGITSVSLRYKLPFEDDPREVNLSKGGLGKSLEDVHQWDLSDLGLLPGDTVTYQLVVTDNDTVNGPKIGVSETGTLHVPSMTDFFSDITETQEEGIERLRDMSDRALQDDGSLEEVRRNVINGEELDWSDKNALDEAKKNLNSMQRDMKDLSEELRRTADKLSEEDMAALETIDKYRQISRLMDQIAEGDMKDALRRLTQADINLDPRKLKEAIEQHKVTSGDIQKKLDRIIELLEQVKTIQRFEMAKRMVEEIAAKQAEISAKHAENPGDPGLKREEERLASEMSAIQKELNETARELGEKFDMNTESFEEYFDSLSIDETMKDAARAMSDGTTEDVADRLKKSDAQLSELLTKMDEMGAMMANTNSDELKRRLFSALSALLAVSDKEERFIGDVQNGAVPATDNDNTAKRQLEVIDAFSKARVSLDRFGELAVEVAGAIDQMMGMIDMTMKNAVDAFAVGQTDKGLDDARKSLRDLNGSIHILLSFLSGGEGDSQGMPGDLMSQLQRIGEGQMSLRMQMEGAGTEELMMQLAAEQQKLAEMLSELGRKLSEDQRLRQMLEKLSEDMDDTASMMRQNKEREYIERKQLDIYRRLLDARRSRRTKDEEDERKSFTAKRNESKGADELAGDLGEKKREINERIDQAMRDDFDQEYLRLIRRYFESMLRDYDTSSGNTPGGGRP